MNTPRHPRPTSQVPVPCGCAPKDDPCPPCDAPPLCELECLVRPEFHCGQELTDDDLNALVRWTDRRLARVRYRDGWGVVCGFGVCIDPRCPTQIVVSPGYAVDCCGDDLVLCEPECLDLREHCPEPCPDDSHENGKSEPEDGASGYDGEAAKRYRDAAAAYAKIERDVDEYRRIQHGGGEGRAPEHRRRVLDICLDRDDHPAVSVPQPGGCGCGGNGGGDDGSCAVIRRREGARLVALPARPHDTHALAREWAEPIEWLREAFYSLERANTAGQGDREAILRHLRKWLLEREICRFGFLRRKLEELPLEELADRRRLVFILFWLILDWRLRRLHRACHACDADDCVRIARVWLLSWTDAQGDTRCEIELVDTTGPARRRLSPEHLAAPAGMVHVPHLALGQETGAAALALKAAGVGVRGHVMLDPTDPDLLFATVQSPVFAAWSDALELVEMPLGGSLRVVGWSPLKRGGNDFAGASGFAAATHVESAGRDYPEPADDGYAEVETAPGKDIDVIDIKGIGKASAEKLNAAGIRSVANFLAALKRDPDMVEALLPPQARDKFREIVEHARRLAAGRG